jgi:hypothetical protein
MLESSEDPNGLHSSGPGGWLLMSGLGSPFQGQGDRHVFCSSGLGEGGELQEQSPGAAELESQTAAQSQVILDGLV